MTATHAANSEVLPEGSVAVAVTVVPKPARTGDGMLAKNMALPFESVVTERAAAK